MNATFDLTLWTNVPTVARLADASGVDRIGLDLEIIGKEKRQRNKGTWISPHTENQLPVIRDSLEWAALFVRCNPYGVYTADEIERLIAAGAKIIMLPNFKTIKEVEKVAGLIGGRARLIPLIERLEVVRHIDQLLKIDAIEELHVGLNDLSFDLKLKNRFSLLHHILLEKMAYKIRKTGKKLGIGGIGRPGDTHLPIPSDLIYARLADLNATGALISRSFLIHELSQEELATQISLVKKRMDHWRNAKASVRKEAKEKLIGLTKRELR